MDPEFTDRPEDERCAGCGALLAADCNCTDEDEDYDRD